MTRSTPLSDRQVQKQNKNKKADAVKKHNLFECYNIDSHTSHINNAVFIGKQCATSRLSIGHIEMLTLETAQTTSECGLRNGISVSPHCVLGVFTPVCNAVHL